MAYKKVCAVLSEPCAALYVRVSTRYQVDKDSLPFQRKKLKEYLKYLGIKKYEIFEDDGYSAKNTDRPEFQKMMSGVRRGQFSHLIVWKVDRISRNLLDFAAMYEELKQHKVTFISLNEQFDTSTAIGEAMLKIILIFAELERKMTAERVMGIMLDRAESGLWNGGHIPFGYRLNDGDAFPVPDWNGEAEFVQMVFNKYEETKSTAQIARMLYHDGIRGRRGGEWTSKVIGDMIRNPFYIGTYRYNVRESSRGAIKPESEWIVRKNNHTPIISEEQFDRCNKIMDENASRNTAKFRKCHVHTFAGLLRCGTCGGGFIVSKDRVRDNGFRPSVYRCTRQSHTLDCDKKTISETVLGPFVLNYAANMTRVQKNFAKITTIEQLERELLRGDEFLNIVGIERQGLNEMFTALSGGAAGGGRFVPELVESFDSAPASAELEILKAEKEKAQRAADRLMELYLFDPESMSAEEMSNRRKEIQKTIRDIQEKIDLLDVPAGPDAADLSFIRKASAFLISQKIVSKKHIDYIDLALQIDTEILKDFFEQIIDHIVIKEGRIMEITFANGLTHKFIYRDKFKQTCPKCGGRIGTTLGCRVRSITYQGKMYRRIKVGDPGDTFEGKKGAICYDCAARFGRRHHYGCEAERCPICGKQYISCEHFPGNEKGDQ